MLETVIRCIIMQLTNDADFNEILKLSVLNWERIGLLATVSLWLPYRVVIVQKFNDAFLRRTKRYGYCS